MILKKLLLRNFRNYENETITFSPHINVICGGNAQGKTNLLEAIFLLSTGRSFLSSRLLELIKENENYFYIEAIIEKDNVEQVLSIYFDQNEKKIQLNSTKYNLFSNLFGLLPAVIFSPQDAGIINGSPNIRRKFFNLHLAQQSSLYIHHLSRYIKAMKQRNFLLRKKSNNTLPWEHEMAKSASFLTKKRKEAIEQLQPLIEKYIKKLSSEKENIELQYVSSLTKNTDKSEIIDIYLKQLEKYREKEKIIGHTLIGPHRDDFTVLINNKNSKLFASEGQKQTFITALRLAEWKRLCNKTDEMAFFHIDDFGVHLDETRKSCLNNILQDMSSQIFITTPTKDFLLKNSTSQIISINNGKVYNLSKSDKYASPIGN